MTIFFAIFAGKTGANWREFALYKAFKRVRHAWANNLGGLAHMVERSLSM